MTRISVITFFQSQDNYGQLLQCYALQSVLRREGYATNVIRYGFHRSYFHWFRWNNFTTKSGFYSLLVHCGLIKRKENIRDRKFDTFRSSYISQTKRCYNNLEELQSNPPKADCYIAGSDQIWAQLLDKTDNRSFFLDFGKPETLRIAYAPSFALECYPYEIVGELKKQLKRFNFISVREKSGVKICDDAGYNAKLVLDPTLLLSPSDYIKLRKLPETDKYCFIYHVNIVEPSNLYWNKFYSYNKDNSIRSVATYANPIANKKMEMMVGADYIYPTIQEWIGWIEKAEYVLTSSFHGMVFAILFHRPFIICLRPDSLFAGNDRVITLLDSLGLEDFIMSPTKDVDTLMSKKIDWASVDKKLLNLKQDSMSFLIGSLKNDPGSI